MKKIFLVFLIAWIIRLGFVLIWHAIGRGDHLSSDALGYYQIAESLARGDGYRLFGELTARRPPLYPLFITFFLKLRLFPIGVQITQSLVGALSCVILYQISKRIFDEKSGLVSACILSVNYLAVRQSVSVLSETLFVFLLLLSFFLYFGALAHFSKWWFFGSGLTAGLSLLTREVLLLYYPFMVLWILLEKAPRIAPIRSAILFLLGFTLAVGPWTLRNVFVFRQFILVTASAGHTIWLSNNPETEGGKTGGDWVLGEDVVYPDDAYADKLSDSDIELDRYFYGKAIHYILKNPGRFFKLMLVKIVNTWRPYQTDSPQYAKWATALTYLPVMFLGFMGLWWSRRRWRELVPIYLLILYIFFLHAILVAQIRYRFPAMPFLMIFAAYAGLEIWNWVKRTLCHE